MTSDEQDALRRRYQTGVRVVFRDANATVSDGVDGLRSGIVNGPIWFADDEEFGSAYAEEFGGGKEGAPVCLSVYASRDNGREPTTILVAWENVVGIEEDA
ncbi:MAG: hypothetical protein ACJ780_10155 [Solirubrobacteraceae bacterium]|jgi:hypothetical protein